MHLTVSPTMQWLHLQLHRGNSHCCRSSECAVPEPWQISLLLPDSEGILDISKNMGGEVCDLVEGHPLGRLLRSRRLLGCCFCQHLRIDTQCLHLSSAEVCLRSLHQSAAYLGIESTGSELLALEVCHLGGDLQYLSAFLPGRIGES